MMKKEREVYWQSKLRRLRIGAEPLTVQVALYRKTTVVLTIVCAGLATVFLAIFASFRRPDIGLIVDLCVVVPIVSIAWLDQLILERRVTTYELERTWTDVG
jgi:hypothetical protein